MKIKVNSNVKANFRPNSARDAYYKRLKQFNGKSVEAFAKSCAEQPPSTPKRGKLKGKPEPLAGWISWFVRQGYLEISES